MSVLLDSVHRVKALTGVFGYSKISINKELCEQFQYENSHTDGLLRRTFQSISQLIGT